MGPQFTKILVAFAFAGATIVPTLAAPFSYVESREIENIDAREPLWPAVKQILSFGAARSVVTKPVKDQAKGANDARKQPRFPTAVQQTIAKHKQESRKK